MKQREAQIEINQRYTSDLISVYPSEDGMTVRLRIDQPMSTFPLMYMGGGEIVLSRNQWRRLKSAIDRAFGDPDATPPGTSTA